MNISEFVKIYKGAIPPQLQKFLTKQLTDAEFVIHDYGKNHSKISNTNLLFRANFDKKSILQISPLIREYVEQYTKDLQAFNIDKFTYRSISTPICNRYLENSVLPFHFDYTHEFGLSQGVPLLSVVGLIKSCDKGGHLEFINIDKIDFEEGDIAIFPSTFLYPHRVSKVEKGMRYSFAAWVW